MIMRRWLVLLCLSLGLVGPASAWTCYGQFDTHARASARFAPPATTHLTVAAGGYYDTIGYAACANLVSGAKWIYYDASDHYAWAFDSGVCGAGLAPDAIGHCAAACQYNAAIQASDSACVLTCDAGQVISGSTCVEACSTNATIPASDAACITSCPAGEVLIGGACFNACVYNPAIAATDAACISPALTLTDVFSIPTNQDAVNAWALGFMFPMLVGLAAWGIAQVIKF